MRFNGTSSRIILPLYKWFYRTLHGDQIVYSWKSTKLRILCVFLQNLGRNFTSLSHPRIYFALNYKTMAQLRNILAAILFHVHAIPTKRSPLHGDYCHSTLHGDYCHSTLHGDYCHSSYRPHGRVTMIHIGMYSSPCRVSMLDWW